MLEFYSASNGTVNSERAMKECLEQVLKGMPSGEKESRHLIIFHTTMGHDFEALLHTAKRMCPNSDIAGCTSAGVIGVEGANEQMRALAVMFIKTGAQQEVYTKTCDNIRGYNSFEKAQQMAKELYRENRRINMLLLLASGIDIAADRAIEGIESVFGSGIPVFGGTSSDNMRAISTYQFYNETILERGAILVGFADESLEIEMGVHHGSIPFGHPLVVTRSSGNQVFELEGQPAWSFLMKKLNLPESSQPGPCIPIAGLAEKIPDIYHGPYDNQHILRVIVKVDETDSSFYMPVDCPEGTELWLTQRDEELIFNGLERMIERLRQRIGNRRIAAVFHTDCAARGRALFNKILKDEIISKMQQPLLNGSRVPWLGMYGFGEFTKLKDRNFFHNYTTSLYVLMRNSEGL